MGGRAGPITYISVFATETSVTGVFPYEHSSPLTGTKLVCISTLGVCELALLVKLQESTKLWQSRTIQVYVPEFIPLDRAEIPHMNTPRNLS